MKTYQVLHRDGKLAYVLQRPIRPASILAIMFPNQLSPHETCVCAQHDTVGILDQALFSAFVDERLFGWTDG